MKVIRLKVYIELSAEVESGPSQISMMEIFWENSRKKILSKCLARGLDTPLKGIAQLTFSCSKSTLETLEQGVKHVQNKK